MEEVVVIQTEEEYKNIKIAEQNADVREKQIAMRKAEADRLNKARFENASS